MRTEEDLKRAIDNHADTVRKICFVQCKNEADVDDLFQEIFLKYYQYKGNFDNIEHEKAWFIRVTINACHDFFRGWFKKKAELTDDFSKFSIDPKNESGKLLEYVRELKPKLRDVLYLHYYEGYTMKEVAEILEINENTVSTRIQRGRKALKEMIGGDWFE